MNQTQKQAREKVRRYYPKIAALLDRLDQDNIQFKSLVTTSTNAMTCEIDIAGRGWTTMTL